MHIIIWHGINIFNAPHTMAWYIPIHVTVWHGTYIPTHVILWHGTNKRTSYYGMVYTNAHHIMACYQRTSHYGMVYANARHIIAWY